MLVQYKGGTHYLCNYLHQQFGDPVCQYLPADPLDDQVVQAFFAALAPLELDAYARAAAARQASERVLHQAYDQQVQRLRYQVALAERQFLQADPDNRLVAAELESRWEQALRELRQAETHAAERTDDPPADGIPAPLREAFAQLGQRLPGAWQAGLLKREPKYRTKI